MATVSSGDGYQVTILNRNQPAFYCVPAELYEKQPDALNLDVQERVKLIAEPMGHPPPKNGEVCAQCVLIITG